METKQKKKMTVVWKDQFSGSSEEVDDSDSDSSSSDDSSSSSSEESSSSSENGSAHACAHAQSSHDIPAVARRQFGLPRFQIRNRRRPPTSSLPTSCTDHEPTSTSTRASNSTSSSSKSYRNNNNNHDHLPHHRRRRKEEPQSILQLYKTSFQLILSKKTSTLLLFSIIIWFYVQYHVTNQAPSNTNNSDANKFDANKHLKQQIRDHLKQTRSESALDALGNAAGNFYHKHVKRASKDGYAPAADRLPKDCEHENWQTLSFPNCNDVHDLDLKEVLNLQREFVRLKRKAKKEGKSHNDNANANTDMNATATTNTTATTAAQVGYLGSGLWRQVWRLQPRIRGEDAVLKVMKAEHKVIPRNFDRHRRDALVMERLTKSKHIVSGYGFCGNTVLTEFAGVTLDGYLNLNTGTDTGNKGSKEKSKLGPKSDTLNSTHTHTVKRNSIMDESTSKPAAPPRYDEQNPLHKIEVALDVMQGLKALHDHDMVHADIQSKQFLLDPVDGIKLNDFNRCRLLPKHKSTGEICKVKIPSAPGGNRSPEEYELQKIDSKIDIFSTGNVLFNILTGVEPWGRDVMRMDIQKNIKKGKLPEISDDFRKPGTIDAGIAEIVVHAYAFRPEDRWDATLIIHELERIKKEYSVPGKSTVAK